MSREELIRVAQGDGLPAPQTCGLCGLCGLPWKGHPPIGDDSPCRIRAVPVFTAKPFTTRACGCPCNCQDIAQARARYDAAPKPVQLALRAAVAALYFADSSDFQTALYQVVNSLDPGIAALVEKDGNAAFRVVYQETEE